MAHKYCFNTTKNHPCSTQYTGCLQNISTIFSNEGEKRFSEVYGSAVALNLDDLEKIVNIAKQNSSCDFMIGVAKNGKDRKIALLECKFNVKGQNFDTKLRSEIEDKVKSSKSLLGSSTPFWNYTYILIGRSCAKQAKNRISRLFVNKSPFKVLDVDTLEVEFF